MVSNRFIFSVIIPAYNAEKYLNAAINSLIRQSIGFDKIQVILVNDGSSDNTQDICNKYKRKYPSNIIFVDMQNGGVSSARNIGLRHATGKYVNFLDADDKWDIEAFEQVYAFFKRHPNVQLAAARMKFFERRTGDHPLNYKFGNSDYIVNIFKDYQMVQNHVTSLFFRLSVLKGHQFDETMSLSEDVKLITEILYDVHEYGLMAKPIHYYRKRKDMSSAIDMQMANVSIYTRTLSEYLDLITLSKHKFGKAIYYAQYVMCRDLMHKLNVGSIEHDSQVFVNYRNLLQKCLAEVDDSIILEMKVHNIGRKILTLSIKYNIDMKALADSITYTNGEYHMRCCTTNLNSMINARTISNTKINTIDIGQDMLKVYGKITAIRLPADLIKVLAHVGNKSYEANIVLDESDVANTPFNSSYGRINYEFEIPNSKRETTISVECSIANGPMFRLTASGEADIKCFRNSRRQQLKFTQTGLSHCVHSNYIIVSKYGNITILKKNLLSILVLNATELMHKVNKKLKN